MTDQTLIPSSTPLALTAHPAVLAPVVAPEVADHGRIVVMCLRQRRQLAQLDPVKLAAIPDEMRDVLTRNALWLFCKHCKQAHRVNFAALLQAKERYLWIGMGPTVSSETSERPSSETWRGPSSGGRPQV